MAGPLRGFADLSVAELRRSAVEDFAVDVKESDNKQTVLAALTESGVTWDDYVKQHPEVAPKAAKGVVTSKDMNTDDDDSLLPPVVEEPVVVAPRVITQSEPTYSPGDVMLVKMERKNLRFDVGVHTFTKEHPYALMTPQDASRLFKTEEGFRPAYPDELQEFYG